MSIRITFAKWLPLGVVITGAVLFTYLGLQQQYRSSLNDPQVQIVRDVTNALERGASPAEVVPRYVFDAAASLAPFVAVFDGSGQSLESSASLSASPLRIPQGVFDTAKKNGEYRVTWQPDSAHRFALVVRPVAGDKGYFVAAGRNMMEVESRIKDLGMLALLAWVLMIVSTLGLEFFGAWRHARAMAAQKAQQPQQHQ